MGWVHILERYLAWLADKAEIDDLKLECCEERDIWDTAKLKNAMVTLQ